MNQIPPELEKYMKQILFTAFLVNFSVFLFFSTGIVTISEAQLRWYGGIFLMIFVCTHGWHRYGLYRMVAFFCLTVAVAWSLETLSISTGFPFGHFIYTDKLGEKIGSVPVMIYPAYFFNGYLAWTMAGVFLQNKGKGKVKKHLVLLPLTAAILMVAWNICFDPIMSTLKGYWIWETEGLYFGVPLSNFFGWLITSYLFFQLYALFLFYYGSNETVVAENYYWILPSLMYGLQGLPYFIYAFTRSQNPEIYQPMGLITVLAMFFPVLVSLIILHERKTDSFSIARINHQPDVSLPVQKAKTSEAQRQRDRSSREEDIS